MHEASKDANLVLGCIHRNGILAAYQNAGPPEHFPQFMGLGAGQLLLPDKSLLPFFSLSSPLSFLPSSNLAMRICISQTPYDFTVNLFILYSRRARIWRSSLGERVLDGEWFVRHTQSKIILSTLPFLYSVIQMLSCLEAGKWTKWSFGFPLIPKILHNYHHLQCQAGVVSQQPEKKEKTLRFLF